MIWITFPTPEPFLAVHLERAQSQGLTDRELAMVRELFRQITVFGVTVIDGR